MTAQQDSSRPAPASKRWRTLAAGALVVVTVGGAAWATSRLVLTRVTIDSGDQVRHFHTRAETVGALLSEVQITLEPEDSVSPGPDTRLRDGMTITVRKAHTVSLAAGDSAWTVRTLARDPMTILTGQGLDPGPNDRIVVDGASFDRATVTSRPWTAAPQHIWLLPSARITVTDGDRQLVLDTTQADVGRALDEAGLALFLADRVTPDLSTPIRDGMTVHIERSQPVTIVADGRRLMTRACGPTVADALAGIGLAPVGSDYTIPPLDTPLRADMVIHLVRVVERIPQSQTEPSLTEESASLWWFYDTLASAP